MQFLVLPQLQQRDTGWRTPIPFLQALLQGLTGGGAGALLPPLPPLPSTPSLPPLSAPRHPSWPVCHDG